MGVTIHLFDEKLERLSYLLAFRRMYGKHTHSAIKKMLRSVIMEFKIKKLKITHIVTNGASNFKKAFNDDKQTNSVDVQEQNEEIGDSIESDIDESFTNEFNSAFMPPDTECEVIDLTELDTDEYCDDDFDENFTLPPQLKCFSHSLNLIGSQDFEKKLFEKKRLLGFTE